MTNKYPTDQKELDYLMRNDPDRCMLVDMDPKEFLSYVHSVGIDSYKIHDISQKIEHGTKLDPLYLEIDASKCSVINHEGRHRAAASIESGIDNVPVVIFFKNETADKQRCCTKNKCNLPNNKKIHVSTLLQKAEDVTESLNEICDIHDDNACNPSEEIECLIEHISETRASNNDVSHLTYQEVQETNIAIQNAKDCALSASSFAEELLSATEKLEYRQKNLKNEWNAIKKEHSIFIDD